ncbi:hypothetical protein AVEN_143446-1 [Araneus ventricosus]|uniref:DUF5641 domain-containing protein n=1 Tax=Araneus ventricosus TaxID=182803 RepID=A0A4Y2A6W4_ARAVE|nr:hypothetical protein AVEN_143446-1 [Araneus ventricosus]
MLLKIGCFLKQRQRSKPDIYNCIQVVVCKCAVSTLQQTCIARRVIDCALLVCRKFVAKLSRQVCHDELISRKITLAASVHAIWARSELSRASGRATGVTGSRTSRPWGSLKIYSTYITMLKVDNEFTALYRGKDLKTILRLWHHIVKIPDWPVGKVLTRAPPSRIISVETHERTEVVFPVA